MGAAITIEVLDAGSGDSIWNDEPVDVLSGELARVWAPFIVVGV